MNKITNLTLHTTAIGEQMAITYSVIDDNGNIISQNKRAEAVVLGKDALDAIEILKQFAYKRLEEN